MAKWIVLALVIVVAGLWGLRKYALDHAAEEGSISHGIYDKRIEADLLEMCNTTVKKLQTPDDETTPAQYASTCKCFADEMSEKLRGVPPGEMQAYLAQDTTMKSAQSIIKKCGHAAGLN